MTKCQHAKGVYNSAYIPRLSKIVLHAGPTLLIFIRYLLFYLDKKMLSYVITMLSNL